MAVREKIDKQRLRRGIGVERESRLGFDFI